MTLAKNYKDLTLVTTVHNNIDYSAAALSSFVDTVGLPSAVVVVDDGSQIPVSPCSYSVEVEIFRNEKPTGFCNASAKALEKVTTPFSLLFDADVRFQPGDFATSYRFFKADSQAAWSGFKQVNFQGGPQFSYQRKLTPPFVFACGRVIRSIFDTHENREPVCWENNRFGRVSVVHSSCVLVRMDAYHAIGGLDRSYQQCESDTELSLRFNALGWKTFVDQGYTVMHEGSGGRSFNAKRIVDFHRARLRLYRQYMPACRFYYKPLVSVRHLCEYFGLAFANKPADKQNRRLRRHLAKDVWFDYRNS